MKKLFFLITLFSLLSTTSYSQWWVSGGNLIWPHGNVTISKGNFNLSGLLEVSGYLQLFNNSNPSASADMVKYYSSDLSSGNTIPSFYTEGTGVITANGNIVNRYNGTVYYLPASTTDISSFLSLSGGTMTGNINMGLTNGIYEIDSIINANEPLNIGTISADNINIIRNGSTVVSFAITGLVGNSSNGNTLDFKWDTDNAEDAFLVDASADDIIVGGGANFYTVNSTGFALADAVNWYSSDLSAGNTIPSFYTEGTGVITANGNIVNRYNGTVRYIPSSISDEQSSGIYVPTMTGVLNVAASLGDTCQFIRIGNTVFISGEFSVDPTATGNVQVDLSLPIASDFISTTNAGGSPSQQLAGGGARGTIYADATNNRLIFVYNATSASNSYFNFTVGYRIL